jgi:hypothetical protein
MTQTNSLFPQLDPIAERRRVLAKVYRLLLRLADEAENKIATSDIAVAAEQKMREPVLVKEDAIKQ